MDIFPILISGRKSYRLISSTDKKTGVHSRIIWCCSWTHDSKYFITGSRDGKVAIWGHQSATSETESPLGQCTLSSKPLELPDQSVTALAAAPVKIASHVYVVAVGLENGCINVYKWSSVSGESGDNWQTCLQLNNSYPFCSILMISILHMYIFFFPSVFPHLCGSLSNHECARISVFLSLLPVNILPCFSSFYIVPFFNLSLSS